MLTLAVCALDGTHLPSLRHAIADAVLGATPGTSPHHAPIALTVPRHRRALLAIAGPLRTLRDRLATSPHERALREPELLADLLRSALDHAEELTGRVTPDDVIGRVFATFCVGK